MRRSGLSIISALCVISFFLAISASGADPTITSKAPYVRSSIEGQVIDDSTGTPIPHATVQAVGLPAATLTNLDGRFRLALAAGHYTIKVSDIGHYSATIDTTLADTALTLEVKLKSQMIYLGEQKVYTRAYDPAQRIILEAIARKKDILSRVHDYSFDGYVKLVLYDSRKVDSEKIMLITETRTSSFWEQPDKYKEIITARTQSANMPADENMIGVGGLLNFNRNRIDLGRYNIVSPTATDALDHYNYYLTDTVFIDSKPVFVLEIEPKNEYEPLFAGKIYIADSTYDVVKVDVGFSKGAAFPMVENPRYYQRMAAISDTIWLPVEIGFSGVFKFKVPIPGIPSRLRFDYVASLSDYKIELGHPKGTFGEYSLEIAKDANKPDTAFWTLHRLVPLSGDEKYGYHRLDSLKHAPITAQKAVTGVLSGLLFLTTFGQHDLYHFNRVEGVYLGLGKSFNELLPGTDLYAKAGYAFDDKRGQYGLAIERRVWEPLKLRLGADVENQIVRRQTVNTDPNYNSTFFAMIARYDPFDYYRETGYNISAAIRPVRRTTLRVGFHDLRDSWLPRRNNFGFFGDTADVRPNAPMANGRLRSTTAQLAYDSRPLINNRGKDLRENASQYLRAEAGIEYASPDLVATDFHYRRYFVRLRARHRFGGLGATILSGYAGKSDWDLPPQRFFEIDFNNPGFFDGDVFSTVGNNNFGGDRIAYVSLVHDFGTHIFRSVEIPALQKIPFGLVVNGGAFWSEFHNYHDNMAMSNLMTAPTAYGEVGFGITNLTPFLSPFNLAVHFIWQTSHYPTNKFALRLGIRL